MIRHKSAVKRARQNVKRNARNRTQRSSLRTVLKDFQAKLEAKDVAGAEKDLVSVHKALDKAVTKGLIHKNAASRRKSRTTLAVRKAGAA
jgi:small subunit ribosomal protein S20